MVCRLFSAKPLCEPVMAHCKSDTCAQISLKLASKCCNFRPIWKCRLQSGGHFFSAPMCKYDFNFNPIGDMSTLVQVMAWRRTNQKTLHALMISLTKKSYNYITPYNDVTSSSTCGSLFALHWRHNDYDCVSNHQPYDCLLNRLFRRKSKKTSKLHVTGLCVGTSPGPVNSPHKGPVTRKMFPFDDVIMDSLFRLANNKRSCHGVIVQWLGIKPLLPSTEFN